MINFDNDPAHDPQEQDGSLGPYELRAAFIQDTTELLAGYENPDAPFNPDDRIWDKFHIDPSVIRPYIGPNSKNLPAPTLGLKWFNENADHIAAESIASPVAGHSKLVNDDLPNKKNTYAGMPITGSEKEDRIPRLPKDLYGVKIALVAHDLGHTPKHHELFQFDETPYFRTPPESNEQ